MGSPPPPPGWPPPGGRPGPAPPAGSWGPPGPAPWPGPPAPARPPARVNPLSVTALVLACMALVPVSAVLAVLALRQVRHRGERGRGLAVGALAVSGFWALAIGAIVAVAVTTGVERDDGGRIVEGGSLSVFDLRVGDCLTEVSDDEEFTRLPAVPCAAPHEGEVYAAFELPAGGFPGETEVAGLAEDGCNDRADVLPPAVAGDLTLGLFTITPSAESWDDGDREVSCLLLSTVAPRTGSVFDR